ncbi:helix-turn-helix domain containing protein [Nocardioides sp. CER19]|uniref:TetR/AcrR family transcriptional regulator n=1 Tax=Nocardioides sp. CER19 TaxID=3038538 RepID=UPI00244C6453|nr:helix-turn-helix domain containing protein [Nocardioides sp. CER19]MDH2413833.1 helix-turn-helix domain containing protein [Nocardioides sp. CER19]
MAPTGTPGQRTRGRPVEIDPSRLSRTAVELFAERGYDEVSAAEIATAAGISRRSLFRYFPTKSDLVWDGFQESLEVLSVALLEHGDHPPATAVVEAVTVTAERTPVVELTRTRLQILAAHPELVALGFGRLDEQIQLCAAYLRNRGVEDLTAQVQAAAITAAAFTGYLHWATATSDPTPAEAVRRSLEAVSWL